MANPQKENGYVKIANELYDAFCRTRIGGEKSQVLSVIIRQTYGFNKKSDMISLSQFCEKTQMPKANVCRAVRQLRAMKIIHTTPRKIATEYSINKNYEEWTTYEPYDRLKIFKEDDYGCHICHLKFEPKDLEVDHIIPLWQNGPNKRSNLSTSCKTCNRKKGADRIHNFDTVAELPPSLKRHQRGGKIDTKRVAKLIHTIDNTKDNIQKTVKTPKEFLVGEQWNQLIDPFQRVNPMWRKLYNSKTERHALHEMVQQIGFDKLKWLIENLKEAVSKPYAPKITKPTELARDMGKLIIFWEQEKRKSKLNKETKIGKL